jgi:hypothetical protein
MQKLQAERDQSHPLNRGGFLNDAAWGSQPPRAPTAQSSAAIPTASAPAAGAPGRAWGGSMLGNIATTAAGVVAGSFLFQGIDRLMHQGDTSWGSGRDHEARAEVPENVSANTFDNDSLLDDTDTLADSGESGDSSDFA